MNIIDFVEQEEKKIIVSLLAKHSEYLYLVGENKNAKKGGLHEFKKGFNEARETKKMETEISDRSEHEATAFFLKNGEMKFDAEVKKDLVQHLAQKVENRSSLQKLTPEQLLACEIQNHTTDFLLQNEVFVFENNI